MKNYRADLHIHTTLSPCGDLEMHPVNIISEAEKKGLDIIGITDHNTTRHCKLISQLAAKKDIFVLQGAEVTTKEEVHCLVFFEKTDALKTFQDYLDTNLPDILNVPEIFGDQVQVDENEMIIFEEPRLLVNALCKSLEEVEKFVHSLNGLFIPAHIDRLKNSIYSQLGFLPDDLAADALEISRNSSPEKFGAAHPEINRFPLITSSDAHYPENIGMASTNFYIENASFSEIRFALNGDKGRRISRI
ncbi:MAG: PHP domain-containing protein [Bacteroidales bacterium]|nr:PHP domain-containing protein [Bacteroidales bacterium]MBK8883100.1 PHP domain-containing protein [Bacteroidales bacterium]